MATAEFKKENVIQILKDSVIRISFEKADGTIREMDATLNPDYIVQPEVLDDTKEQKLNKKKNDSAVAVWDLDKAAWRSFRWDKLKTINSVEVKLLES